MKRAILKIITFTIVIGVFALAFNMAFGNQTITYLTKIRVNTTQGNNFYYYKFDFWNYLKNIQLTTSDISVLTFEMPTRTWQSPTDITDFFPIIANDLAVILDYVIMIINILLYPLRVGAYLIRNVLAILGVNTDTTNEYNGLAWLIKFVRDILSRIAIPYI